MVPRPEHPNPIFRRGDSEWLNLNGTWQFAICSTRELDPPQEWDGDIKVPFCLQAEASGALSQLSRNKLLAARLSKPPLANNLRKRDALWYKRKLPSMPSEWRKRNMHVILHFGACDSVADVSVNGKAFPQHQGGSVPFCFDITDSLYMDDASKANVVTVRCTDCSEDGGIAPCGKQLAKAYPKGICVPTLYSNITGIWQTVWLEAVSDCAYLKSVQVSTVLGNSGKWRLNLYPEIQGGSLTSNFTFEATLFRKLVFGLGRRPARVVTRKKIAVANLRSKKHFQLIVPAADSQTWSPEDPHLYGLRFRLYHKGCLLDEVESYAALRTVACSSRGFALNGKPVHLRLVLDQGYYPDGLWTAPSDIALRRDIELAMRVGFNGARLHQKVFEPRYFFHADQLGFLVFSEYPDWPGGKTCRWQTTTFYKQLVEYEWAATVRHLHNHPSIIAWGVFNEFGPKGSWEFNAGAGGGFRNYGTPQKRKRIIDDHKSFVRRVVRRVRKLDLQKRPVHDSSGWIHVDSDVWGIHEYCQRAEKLSSMLSALPRKHVDGHGRQPLLVTEYGGVGLDLSGPIGMNPKQFLAGYNGKPGLPKTKASALARIADLTAAINKAPNVSGYCYTQLYDVEFEKNGILRYDRSWKFPPGDLKAIFGATQLERSNKRVKVERVSRH